MLAYVIVHYSNPGDELPDFSPFWTSDPDPEAILEDYKAAGKTVDSLTIYDGVEEAA
jgi:hypothetical protein